MLQPCLDGLSVSRFALILADSSQRSTCPLEMLCQSLASDLWETEKAEEINFRSHYCSVIVASIAVEITKCSILHLSLKFIWLDYFRPRFASSSEFKSADNCGGSCR